MTASPFDGMVRLGQANMQLGFVLADTYRAGMQRMAEIGAKLFGECSTEADAVAKRMSASAKADDEDVHPGQWDDIVTDMEALRLEMAEGVMAACDEWRKSWLGGANNVADEARKSTPLILNPWPVGGEKGGKKGG